MVAVGCAVAGLLVAQPVTTATTPMSERPAARDRVLADEGGPGTREAVVSSSGSTRTAVGRIGDWPGALGMAVTLVFAATGFVVTRRRPAPVAPADVLLVWRRGPPILLPD
jgi:hypothetical protein